MHVSSSLSLAAFSSLLLVVTACATSAPVAAPEPTIELATLADMPVEPTIYVAPSDYFSDFVNGHQDVLHAVEGAASDYLIESGFTVLPTEPFREAWKEVESVMGGLFDAQTGLIDVSKMNECYSRTVARLARKEAFDAVLIPMVEYENILLEPPYRKASWAGVVRRVQFDGALTETRWTSMLAMTLKPRLVTKDGELAFESAAGIDFAQKTVWTIDREIRLEAKEAQDFRDDQISESVELALRPLVEACQAGV